jgi:hypothetical protein
MPQIDDALFLLLEQRVEPPWPVLRTVRTHAVISPQRHPHRDRPAVVELIRATSQVEQLQADLDPWLVYYN